MLSLGFDGDRTQKKTITTIAMTHANESTWDRVLRVALGLIMLYFGWFILGDGLTAAIFKIFGFIPLITGLLGWCPFYTLLGWSTRKVSRPD